MPPSMYPLTHASTAAAAANASATATPAPPPASHLHHSVDLFMLLFISVFLFITATVLRVIPWPAPLQTTHGHASRLRHTRARWAGETDVLRGFSPVAYGALDMGTSGAAVGVSSADAAAAAAIFARSASAPTYEALLEIGDSIGAAKRGFSDDQIAVLPSYVCDAADPAQQQWLGAFCAICRDEYVAGDNLRILPCGDEFHRDCIAPWLRQQASCPLCRCRFA